MQYRQLGKSSLRISTIGFGCMSLPVAREQDCTRLLHRAIELGINFFDTADLYDKGLNEEIVGRALKQYRGKVIIATKVGNQWRPDGSGWDWNPSKDYILRSVERSLQRLQLDHIDLYQLHGGTIDDPIDDTIEAFESLKQQGKIRYYGLSSIRPNVIREYVKRSSIVSVMTQYSLADRRPEETTLSLLEQNNIGVLARGALAQGMLAGKPASDYLGHSKESMEAAAQLLQGVSTATQTPAQTALLYVLRHPAITTVVAGMSRLEQLTELAATPEKGNLSNEDASRLQSTLAPKIYEQHR